MSDGRGGTIRRGVARVERVAVWGDAGEWAFTPPKSKRGKRPDYFPVALYSELLKHRERQERRARVLGATWQDHGLVFPARDGLPFKRDAYARRLTALLKRAELPLPCTPYTLRYSFATLARLAGESDVNVSRQREHSRVNFTKDVYVKTLPEMQQGVAGRLEEMLLETVGNQPAHLDAKGVM